MSGLRWRMSVYDLRTATPCTMPEGTHAFVYAERGQASVTENRAVQLIAAGDGAFAEAGAVILSTGTAWIYEIAPISLPLRLDEGVSLVLSRIAVLTEGPYILRADRVESAAGAQTPSHHHRGPGIRRLEHGLLRAKVGEGIDRISAGGAWFESGHESVVGTNISDGVNVFIRVMLLPAELAGGKSSFVATTPAEAAKPRAVNLLLFGERAIS
jgi:hypothetical protein